MKANFCFLKIKVSCLVVTQAEKRVPDHTSFAPVPCMVQLTLPKWLVFDVSQLSTRAEASYIFFSVLKGSALFHVQDVMC